MAVFPKEYTTLDELGKGGFATVYKIRHNELGYVRAIRVLNETISDSSSKTYQNFLRECKILLRLGNGNHPNIVHIYQPRLLDNKALVEMDYIDGADLQHYLKQNQYFVSADEVIRMAKQISSALAYCHEDIYEYCMDRDIDNLKDDPNDGSKVLIDEATRERLINKYKVVHNDIHSGNIMRRKNGDFVLLDFGLAINGDEVVRSSRRANGAPEFKAPEKWDNLKKKREAEEKGKQSDDRPSDIYSFGIVLYQYLAGHVPFPYNINAPSDIVAEFELMNAHKTATPPAIEELRKEAFEKKFEGETYKRDYPQWLENAILKCIEKDPKKRFKNGKELYEYITKHLKIQDIKEESCLSPSLSTSLESYSYCFEKGVVQEILRNYELSAFWFKEAAYYSLSQPASSDNNTHYYERGMDLMRLKNYENAMYWFKQAAKTDYKEIELNVDKKDIKDNETAHDNDSDIIMGNIRIVIIIIILFCVLVAYYITINNT